MIFKTYEINVDLIKDAYAPEVIRFSQNDLNSAKLLLNIKKMTEELDLSQAKSVRMSFKKPDGTRVFQNDCQPINPLKGKYQIVLKTQTLTAAGDVIAQVHIEEEDRTIDTQAFYFKVNKSLSSDEAIESTNEFGVIQKIIESNEKLEGVDFDALVASEKTAESALAQSTENTNQIGILSKKTSTWVTAEDFSAVGNGIADDTDALIQLTSSGVNKLQLGFRKTYKVRKPIPVSSSYAEIDLNGSTIIFDSTSLPGTNNNLFYVQNGLTNPNSKRAKVTNVGVYYKLGNTPEKIMGKFTVDSVTNFKVGDTVVIEYQTESVNKHTLTDLKPSVGTHAKILEIDTVNKIVYTDYYTELDFRNLPPVAESGFMYVTTPVKNITIKNGTLKSVSTNASGKKDCAIRAEYVDGINIENITTIDFNQMAVQPRWVRNITVRNLKSEEQQGDKPLSYVIQCLNTYSGVFENISGTTNDAIIDFSFGSSHINVRNARSSNANGAWGAIQLHGECEHDITFENCTGFFSFANNTGEFPGYSYNITLDKCKGVTYLTGCDNLRIINSNLIAKSTDFSNLRIYGVTINDSKIQLVKSVLYKASNRGGVLSPYIRFSNCDVSPYSDGTTGLYKYPFIQFDEISFANNCRVKNRYQGVGAYFMLDSIKNFEYKNSVLEGFVFTLRVNDGGTSTPFTFSRFTFNNNIVSITDENCTTKESTSSLDALFGFMNISDLTGLFTVKGNEFFFKKTHTRNWKFIELGSITPSSALKFFFDNNRITADTPGEISVHIPHNTGYAIEYNGNIINPDIVPESGDYRLSNFYTAAPTSGMWIVRKNIYNKTPTANGKIGWVCVAAGTPGTWKTYGTIDA
ncbi:BppU family phage baseplate upper protein [Bacillus mycoides]|uniref:BppU family phage baseplate upper protein n=1 Tax=Bacillus mycoides TaxID=1405 RepID=UPI002E1D1CA8|nr:BppU family phage baseplate upper protein [Bacillus mycoides]MED1054371.1 BppU family phage baseplate upper protein [Bacillus mycoides]